MSTAQLEERRRWDTRETLALAECACKTMRSQQSSELETLQDLDDQKCMHAMACMCRCRTGQ